MAASLVEGVYYKLHTKNPKTLMYFNRKGGMDYMKDGLPHKCIYAGTVSGVGVNLYQAARFAEDMGRDFTEYDTSYRWWWWKLSDILEVTPKELLEMRVIPLRIIRE